ncbi:DUF4397 domain-containing protein [Clostridium chauvoei]|uniref:DUF4397 domain-containing protein n=1 Tax=Clostridium chauvoei TaxID=46867 RepID=A0ABD4RI53_9CLOT|nr:DUF4397 domain-containing protein [Clostridium chauvoei]MBX7283512.1 DUF4397 domain-containing protein [Clostridium chauvoei]MBX7286075.1 DUF4397 domain-containing protein [Clostridium chauvoei]MBX7288473.1 DUF4397 domain-containing protein [Clostridium chauvoei]MBX7291072.1 DUF4397 domain-containing protein [Clostridium chauvoei]
MLFRDNLPDLQCKVRLIHAVPAAPAVDIYANGSPIAKNLSFSDISCYIAIAPGTYEIQIFVSGTYDSPLLTKTIDLLPNSASTISIITNNNNLDLFVLNDANNLGQISNAFLRFINLSPNSPLLTLSLPNDISLFNSVEYIETTGYYPLSPGIYNYKVSFASSEGLFKFIKDIKLENGQFYTIYIVGLFNKKPQLGYVIVKDGI